MGSHSRGSVSEEYGVITEKQKQVVQILEVIRVEDYIQSRQARRGRKRHCRRKMARGFIVKAVYNLPSTRALIELLQSCPMLRRVCGYERVDDIPDESTFSRAFEDFAHSGLLNRIHEVLIAEHCKERLVGHVSRDSSAIEGNEKPVKKAVTQVPAAPKRKRGRPRKGEKSPPKELTRLERQATMSLEEMLDDLPKPCDRGCKKNSQGYKESWNGYKLHLDCADGQIPISCIVTSASLHDSQVAIPLATLSAQRVTSLYDLMDAGYDAQAIHDHSVSLGHVPLIDPNPRRGEKEEMDPAAKQRYKERTAVERVFGRLKEEFGASQVRVRGHAKVTAHLMFGVLALMADQLLRLVAATAETG